MLAIDQVWQCCQTVLWRVVLCTKDLRRRGRDSAMPWRWAMPCSQAWASLISWAQATPVIVKCWRDGLSTKKIELSHYSSAAQLLKCGKAIYWNKSTMKNGNHENCGEHQSFSTATGRNQSVLWKDLMVAAGNNQLHPSPTNCPRCLMSLVLPVITALLVCSV